MVHLMGKDQCKPRQIMTSALSRSLSTGDDNKKGRPHNGGDRPLVRYAPYSIPSTRSCGSFPSRPRHREASRGKRMRMRVSCPGEGNENISKDGKSLSLSGVQEINRNFLKRHQLSLKDTPSVLDVASDLRNSLVIGDRNPKTNQLRNNTTESCTLGRHVTGFLSDEEWKTNAFYNPLCRGDYNNETKDKQETTQDTEEGFSDGFLPSFDDTSCFTEVMWPLCGGTKSSQDIGKEMKSPCRKDTVPEEEDVVKTLRTANTVVLFDDDDDEKFDFDLSGCLPFSQSSCEGLRAKVTWDKMAAQEGGDNQRDNSVFGEELERRLDFNLHDILADDWLNGHQRLMTSDVPGYTDLHDMQGTYTCSVCSTNLEVDPFNTRGQWDWDGNPSNTGRDIVFPSWSSNQSGEWRSHECDVLLFCPSCCSNRLVFHADRL